MAADAINALAGIATGSPLDVARSHRLVARTQAQASHDALLKPADPGGVPVQDRLAVAAFVAGLHGPGEAAFHYASVLAALGALPGLCAAVAASVSDAPAHGPYGSYPAGPLTPEDTPGPAWRVPDPHRAILGMRLAAALEHAHMLVLHPRDAAPGHLQALLDAGWDTQGIVTLSQLVAFLSYQIRVAAGLRVLAAAEAHP